MEFKQLMTNFKYIPNYSDLRDNNSSYFETQDHSENIKSKLTIKHNDYDGKISPIPLSFLNAFINSQSSLYSNEYIRNINDTLNTIDYLSLNESMVFLEVYYNLHTRSAIHVYTENGIQKFEALDPTRYYKEGNYTFIASDDITLLYIMNGDILELYEISMSLEDAVNKYDLDIEPLKQYYNDDDDTKIVLIDIPKDGIKQVPLIEVTYYNMKQAQINPLTDLQMDYILAISWGLFTGQSKLISQVVLGSDMKLEDAKSLFNNFGSTTNIIKTAKGDKFEIFDSGNVQILLDVFKTYNEIISIKAVQKGADINSIIPQEEIQESGVAKQIKLDYINKYRKKHFFTFKQFEQNLWNLLLDGFNINVDFTSIKFLDLVINETPMEKLEYNDKLYSMGLLNKTRLYAVTFGMTYDEALVDMAKYNLTDTTTL